VRALAMMCERVGVGGGVRLESVRVLLTTRGKKGSCEGWGRGVRGKACARARVRTGIET